jgi:hypothetical protein
VESQGVLGSEIERICHGREAIGLTKEEKKETRGKRTLIRLKQRNGLLRRVEVVVGEGERHGGDERVEVARFVACGGETGQKRGKRGEAGSESSWNG